MKIKKLLNKELVNFWTTPAIYWGIFFILIVVASYLYCFSFQYSIYELLKHEVCYEGHEYPRQKTMELVPLIFVVLIGIVVTIVNTVIYLIGMIREKETPVWWTSLWLILSIVAIVYIVIISTIEASSILHHIHNTKTDLINDKSIAEQSTIMANAVWEKMLNFIPKTEIFSFFVFLGLLAIDLFDYFWIKNRTIKKYSAENSSDLFKLRACELKKNSTWQQLCFIDIPVLLGILFVFIFMNIGVDLTMLRYMNINDIAIIFGVGSTGMTIIYSQVVFLLLNTRFCWQMHKFYLQEPPPICN